MKKRSPVVVGRRGTGKSFNQALQLKLQPRVVRFSVVHANVLSFEVDALVLKYAQRLHGADDLVFNKLSISNVAVPLPAQTSTTLVEANVALRAEKVLFVGVGPLREFSYPEIRDFARRALTSLRHEMPSARSLAFTIHGAGYGLDENEAFGSEIAGIVDALLTKDFPRDLTSITFVEINRARADRLSKALQRIFPNGVFEIENDKPTFEPTNPYQQNLRTAGYSSASKPHVFVAMPFVPDMDDTYHYGIQGAVNRSGYLCERADMSAFTGDVMEWVKACSCRLVVREPQCLP
jgi:hypothetical protein